MGLKKYALAVLLLLLPAVALAQVVDPISINNTVTVTADNQFTVANEATSTASVTVLPAPPATVPTLSSTGLTALTVLLAGLGVLVMRRRTRRSA
jgi:hypothetical protein